MPTATNSHTTPPAGRVEVLPQAIARIAARAATTTDNVLGLANGAASADTPFLPSASSHRGVAVTLHDGAVTAEVFLVIRYGARVGAVAEEVRERVRAALERALGAVAVTVEVRVQGLRAE